MSNRLRTLAIASAIAALIAPVVPVAHAGGIQATVEGPAKDGTYLVRTYHCGQAMPLEVTAFAEGVVKGERHTLPLELEPTRDDGVYRLRQTWPSDGRWLLRLDMGHNMSVVATLAANGRVKESQMRWDCDGHQLCDQKLAAFVK